jgi:putative nucleotidyltransferase with HDIG domain
VLSSLDTHEIATTVVSSIARVVPSSAVASLIVNDDGTSTITVWRAAHNGPPLTIVGGPIDVVGLDDVVEWSSAQRASGPPAVRSILGDHAARLLTVPVNIEGHLAAILALEQTGGACFEPEHIEAVRQVGQQVAIALTNARLVQRLERLHFGALNALARTIDAKSPWTAGHADRVTAYGVALATRLGLDPATVATMRRGGLLHDIGKIAVPSHILDKPGPLTPDEMAIVKRHPEVGARILEPVAEYASAIPIVLEHHERWDGTGYPFGLQGEAISLGGRIFALADVFDALTSDRPYRRGWSLDAVAALFVRETGRHFDPSLAPLFIEMMPDLQAREVATSPRQMPADVRWA